MAERTVAISIADVEPVTKILEAVKVAVERIRELHAPVDEEAEFWFDSSTNTPSAHCASTCTDTTCKGHTATVKVCRECGYEHDDGMPTFRSWPCPTMQAITELVTPEDGTGG